MLSYEIRTSKSLQDAMLMIVAISFVDSQSLLTTRARFNGTEMAFLIPASIEASRLDRFRMRMTYGVDSFLMNHQSDDKIVDKIKICIKLNLFSRIITYMAYSSSVAFGKRIAFT